MKYHNDENLQKIIEGIKEFKEKGDAGMIILANKNSNEFCEISCFIDNISFHQIERIFKDILTNIANRNMKNDLETINKEKRTKFMKDLLNTLKNK